METVPLPLPTPDASELPPPPRLPPPPGPITASFKAASVIVETPPTPPLLGLGSFSASPLPRKVRERRAEKEARNAGEEGGRES